MRNINDLKNLDGKKVIVRIDTDVDLKHGQVVDDSRLRAALPTIKHLIKEGAVVTLMGYLGRPEGEDERYSLEPVAHHLAHLLTHGGQARVIETDHQSPVFKKQYQLARRLTLLENLRFDPGENKNHLTFAKQLAANQDYYVNESFATAHRANASIVGIAELLPSYAGLRLIDEIAHLNIVKDTPTHPFVMIIGGAKLEEKVGLLQKLLPKVDYILTGGVTANVFLKAAGVDVKKSLSDPEFIPVAKDLLKQTTPVPEPENEPEPETDDNDVKFSLIKNGRPHGAPKPVPEPELNLETINQGKIQLPVDYVWERGQILDIGPETVSNYKKIIKQAKLVFWAGSLGYTEKEAFMAGTEAIARTLANHDGIKMIGGGDTATALNQLKLADKMTFVSVGGGAALEYLAGKELPGLVALK